MKYSVLTRILTAAVLILFAAGIIILRDETRDLALFCIIAGTTTASGLYYGPKEVEANESGVIVHRILSNPKVFSYSEIESVDTCYPSGGGIRICGSGGFFGYWGYFSDIMIGTYFGYYGSRSFCFCIKLKSGRQYVIGCTDPAGMAAFISDRLEYE